MSALAAPRARSLASPAAEQASVLRLASFTALCAFATGHWAGLVVDPPAWRLAGVAAVAVLGGLLLAATARLRAGLAAAGLVRALVALGTLLAALGIAGLDLRLLLPGNWLELREGLDEGFAALTTIDWPYGGDDEWVRRTLMLGAPVLAAPAAALAFWPAGRAAPALRAAALVLLLVLYGTAVTEREFQAEVFRGVLLALLVGFWLWPPRIAARDATVAAAVVIAAALLSLPAALALDREEPLIDYRSWTFFGSIQGVAFDWNHDYGPIDWSRDGVTVLQVKSERPLYWRVATLGRFDGLQWVHSREQERGSPYAHVPPVPEPRWIEEVEVRVRNLHSEVVVAAGTPLRIEGLGQVFVTGDNTAFSAEGSLREGDEYVVDAYVPDPSAESLRGAPESGDPRLAQYTRIELPRTGETADEGVGLSGDAARSAAPPPEVVRVPFHGRPPGELAADVDAALRASPYARTYALARSLARGAPSAYDVVKRVERHLLDNYAYDENPPEAPYPIEDFLFRDRLGYCQQFSGAMALMLRMNGIPARVVGGFAPGSFNRDRGEFRVRDLDAHSWVEVHFPGVGWVQFDPTPAAAPAESRAFSERAGDATAAVGNTDPGGASGRGDEDRSSARPGRGGGEDDRIPPWALPAALLASGAAVLVALRARAHRRRRRRGVDRAARELVVALERLGYVVPPRTTLFALERRLERIAGPAAGAYARALRVHRYGPDGGELPGAAARRRLRRELARAGGRLARLRVWTALPPFSRN